MYVHFYYYYLLLMHFAYCIALKLVVDFIQYHNFNLLQFSLFTGCSKQNKYGVYGFST